MRKKEELNCPNCGAPITGEKCEYCGTVFYDWAVIDSEKDFYVKIRLHNNLVMCKARMASCDIKVDSGDTLYYGDNNPIYVMHVHEPDIEIRPVFRIVPEDGILYKRRIIDDGED